MAKKPSEHCIKKIQKKPSLKLKGKRPSYVLPLIVTLDSSSDKENEGAMELECEEELLN